MFLNAAGEYPDEDNPIHQAAIADKAASLTETQRCLQLREIKATDAQLIEHLYEGLASRLQVKQNLNLVQETKQLVIAILHSN